MENAVTKFLSVSPLASPSSRLCSRALGYGNSREALRKHVMEDDVTKRDTIDSLGRKQQTSQKRVEQGLFETSVSLIETHHGTIERCNTKVTGKSQ